MEHSEYLIWETKSFELRAEEHPLVDRADGGHIAIYPKRRMADRQELSAKEAMEFMRLTMVAGEAMTTALNKNGIDVGRINYQDNGNWGVFTTAGPYFHLHLYGRARSAKVQKFGESLHFPHRNTHPELYANLEPISKSDIAAIREEMQLLFNSPRYSDKEWALSSN